MYSNNKEKQSIRVAYGKTLVELGAEDTNIVVLDADLSCSTQTKLFSKEYPERFFNIGIAEQNLIEIAAGLASQGKIPFASTFAMFASGRAWEQIRNSVAYSNFNVKIVATHGGITVGEDGASHQALEDISIMRSIPNMMVIVPCDYNETVSVIKYAAKHKGPMYIRLARTNVINIFNENYRYNPLKAVKIKEGKDISVITNGETLAEVIEAGDILGKKGIDIEIIHVPTVKPIDKESIIETAKKTRFVITVENHSIIGGLGTAVCEVLSEDLPTRVKRIGTKDTFGQSGEQRSLMQLYGLTGDKIAERILEINKETDK